MMRRQIDHLTRLVNDLLDISRISRGHAELQRGGLDLRLAVEDAVEQSRPLITERQHTLTVELGDTPLQVDGDPQRLTQVFGNLFRNAARQPSREARSPCMRWREGGAALVRVADKGYGIPKEHVKDHFRNVQPSAGTPILGRRRGPRHRARASRSSTPRVAWRLRRGAERRLGPRQRIHRASAARRGSLRPSQRTRPRHNSRISPRRRVLVVDDNADAAATLRMLLEVQGHEARAAYTGPAALDVLAQFDA